MIGGRKVKGLILCFEFRVLRQDSEDSLTAEDFIEVFNSKAFFILTRERRFIACKSPIDQLTKLTNNESLIIAHYGYLCFLF